MKRFLVVITAVAALASLLVAPVFGADKLLVKNGTNTVFVVQDTGKVGFGNAAPTEFIDVLGDNVSTASRLTKFGGNPGTVFRAAGGSATSPSQVLANQLLGSYVAAGYTSAGAFSGNKVGMAFKAAENFTATAQGTYITFDTTTAGTTSKINRVTISDAGLNVVGTISQTSSRAFKDNIHELAADEAMETIKNLVPVTYNYKHDDQGHVGFIAEDVPDLVAAKDRKSLSPMDIVAVLTKVVQEQNETLDTKSQVIEKQQKVLDEQQKAIAKMSEKLDRLERMLQLKGAFASKGE